MSRLRAVPLAAVVAAALFAAAFATTLVPWLTRPRTFISSTPTTAPRSVIPLRVPHGGVLCVRGAGLDRDSQALRFAVYRLAGSPKSPPVRVEVQAPGYRSITTLAGGYPFDTPVAVPVKTPPGELRGVEICLRNEGPAAGFASTIDRNERSGVTVSLDAKKIVLQPWLTFVERRPASALGHAGEILDRIAAFRPFPAVAPLLGVLAVLVLLGVPAAVIGALALAERADANKPGDDSA